MTRSALAVAILLATVVGGGVIAPGTAAANSYTVIGGNGGQGWSVQPWYASLGFVECRSNSRGDFRSIDVHFNQGNQGWYWSRIWLKDLRTNRTLDYGTRWHDPNWHTFRGDRWISNLPSGRYQVYAQVGYVTNGRSWASSEGWFTSYRNLGAHHWFPFTAPTGSVCEIRG